MQINIKNEMEISIKITEQSFSDRYFRSVEAKFRSLEKFLEKHSRKFEVDDYEKIITVSVKDEIDARWLSGSAKLKCVTYCAEGKTKELEINVPKKKGRPRNTVLVNGVKKGMTINQFKNFSLKELKKTHLTKAHIVKAKILKKAQLEKFLSDGTLVAVNRGKTSFIERESVFKLM